MDIEKLIFLGAGVGLKPKDIYEMEFWEFNSYVLGYRELLLKEQLNIMKQSYYTGMFSRETKQKPKPLEHYLGEIEKDFRKDAYKNKPVDKEKSWSIHDSIQRLKGE